MLVFSNSVFVSSALSAFAAISQQNTMIFRRLEHKVLDASYFESVTFDWRLIARNTIRINITLQNLQKDVQLVETNIGIFYRYVRWQRITGSMWENLCDAFDPKKFTPILDLLLKNMKNYTNAGHPCPYVKNETIYAVADRYNLNDFKLPFIPSGQYRVDMTLTDGRERHPLFFTEFYFDISDHRTIVV